MDEETKKNEEIEEVVVELISEYKDALEELAK